MWNCNWDKTCTKPQRKQTSGILQLMDSEHVRKMRRYRNGFWTSPKNETIEMNSVHIGKMTQQRWISKQKHRENLWEKRKCLNTCTASQKTRVSNFSIVSDFGELGNKIVTGPIRKDGTLHLGVIGFYKIMNMVWYDWWFDLIQTD